MKRKTKMFLSSFIFLILIASFSYYKFKTKSDINSINLKELEPKDFNLSKEDYIEDFDFVYKTLKEYYPFFELNSELNNINWLDNKEKYESYISNSTNDISFYQRMNEVLNELNNPHTQLIPESYGVHMYLSYYHLPSSNWRHDISKLYEKDDVRRRYNINNETIEEYIIERNNNDDSTMSPQGNLIAHKIIEDELAYVKVNSMLNDLYIKNDKQVLKKFLKEIKDYNNLILDIRDNTGGSTEYWQKFLLPKIIDRDYETTFYLFIKSGKLNKNIREKENFKTDVNAFLDRTNFTDEVKGILQEFDCYLESKMIVKPDINSIKFKGNIYLLVDDSVYSSSEALASFCKETGLAKLVGTKTGGDGIGIDPIQINLPNSGYVLRFPNNLGVTSSGSINELDKTNPDIIVEKNITDIYSNFLDQKIIQAVIEDAKTNR